MRDDGEVPIRTLDAVLAVLVVREGFGDDKVGDSEEKREAEAASWRLGSVPDAVEERGRADALHEGVVGRGEGNTVRTRRFRDILEGEEGGSAGAGRSGVGGLVAHR